MLDETTCPVCGKVLWSDDWRDDMFPQYGSWAVAHYLAHLVHQNAVQVTMDETAAWLVRQYPSAWKVDNLPPQNT